MVFQADPYTGYRLEPEGKGKFLRGEITADANRFGHRDDEVSLEKPEDVFRILVLGDSFTVGACVEQTESYPEVLERHLNDGSDTEIEVVNTGVGGWCPFQYAQYYEYYGQKFEPDLVLVGFFVGNDTYYGEVAVEELDTAIQGRRISHKSADNPFLPVKVFLYNHSNLARLLMANGGMHTPHVTREDCLDFNIPLFLRIQKNRLRNHLRRSEDGDSLAKYNIRQMSRIRDIAGRHSAAVVVALLPDENQLNPALRNALIDPGTEQNYDFEMPQTMLREMLEAEQIVYIDLLPAFRNDTRCLHLNDTHWTPEGHRLAAEVIAAGLRKKYLPD
jgi:lysophospholipase L1-like esterase